jgi:6-phosphofructokinase 1
MPTIRKLGVLTGGGDAPGLNAVIRAVVKTASNADVTVVGLEDSFDGLIYPEKSRVLTPKDVTGILRLGGTILGTVNRGNPFAEPMVTPHGTFDYGDRVMEMFQQMELDALVCIGGDGTLAISYEFYRKGIPLVGVPKTIDNDIPGTTSCFGFDTAVSFATDAIDRLHTTAEAHRRIIVVEVMGRYAGWIALHAGTAGGADVILIPEIPYDFDKVVDCLRKRDERGAKFSIVVVAEGARPKDGKLSIRRGGARRPRRATGWGGEILWRRADAAHRQGNPPRRAGSPAARRRPDGIRSHAGHAVRREGGGAGAARAVRKMVANHPPELVPIPLGEVVGRTKLVPLDYDLLQTAKMMGRVVRRLAERGTPTPLQRAGRAAHARHHRDFPRPSTAAQDELRLVRRSSATAGGGGRSRNELCENSAHVSTLLRSKYAAVSACISRSLVLTLHTGAVPMSGRES